MTSGLALNPLVAAKALAAWWKMAGLEPVDIDLALKTAQRTLRASAEHAPKASDAVKPPAARAQPAAARKPSDALAGAQRLASACTSVEALYKAISGFDGCALKTHARNTVLSAGTQGAPIMIIGEAPDRDDDASGRAFGGSSGELLDKMLASIGLYPASNCYLTHFIPWRPAGDRKPTSDEIAICKPFVVRHIELAAPKAILFVGGLSAQTLLDVTDSIMKLRTKRFTYGSGNSIYAQCLLSPAYLLNRPSEKALAWRDLLRFQREISARGIALAPRPDAQGG
jgi:uracil-DNA glycosylase